MLPKKLEKMQRVVFSGHILSSECSLQKRIMHISLLVRAATFYLLVSVAQ